MSLFNNIANHPSYLVAGAWLWHFGVAPAIASGLDVPGLNVTVAPLDLVLVVAVAVLAAALALRIQHRRRNSEAKMNEPDMRWWHRSEP